MNDQLGGQDTRTIIEFPSDMSERAEYEGVVRDLEVYCKVNALNHWKGALLRVLINGTWEGPYICERHEYGGNPAYYTRSRSKFDWDVPPVFAHALRDYAEAIAKAGPVQLCERCGGTGKLTIEGMPIKQCPDCSTAGGGLR